MEFERAIIIRDKTRLEQLIERFNSKAQAKFYIERSGGNLETFEKEHSSFYSSLKEVENYLGEYLKTKVLFRSFLPTYIFSDNDLVVVVGQDGLVANTAKYVNELPILAVNPDPQSYDGVLLPFEAKDVKKALQSLVSNKFMTREITMAEAKLNDGQRLLAFNDFFIGASSHVSARYQITYKGETESQSSSGILISTGAGSSGWLSSVFNMVSNIHGGSESTSSKYQLKWEDEKLVFVVREPFKSKLSDTHLGFGLIEGKEKLKIESGMPANGVIFSDGIESDFMSFNLGSSVEIGVAKEKANLLII